MDLRRKRVLLHLLALGFSAPLASRLDVHSSRVDGYLCQFYAPGILLPDQRDGLLFNDYLSVSAGVGQVPEPPLPGVPVVLPDDLSAGEPRVFS